MAESTKTGPWPLSPAHVIQLFSLCEELVCAHDADGRIVLANPAFERVLGYTHDELVAARFTELIPEKHLAEAHKGQNRRVSVVDAVKTLSSYGMIVNSGFVC